jgi:hypothetical protein
LVLVFTARVASIHRVDVHEYANPANEVDAHAVEVRNSLVADLPTLFNENARETRATLRALVRGEIRLLPNVSGELLVAGGCCNQRISRSRLF